MRKTWNSINSILNRDKVLSTTPEKFIIDGAEITDSKLIANQFNDFFVNIGVKLATSMNVAPSEFNYEKYLKKNQQVNLNSQKISAGYVRKKIDSLKNKTSYGYDFLSNRIIKYIKNEIAIPITH